MSDSGLASHDSWIDVDPVWAATFWGGIGGEDVENLKPDPEGLIKVLSNLGVFSAEAIYVGDSLIDAKTAKEANVPFVAVLSGVTSSDSFISEGCENIVKDITALPTMLFS